MFSLQVDSYTGPLDALLALAERGDLPVADLPLTVVVRQYALYRAHESASAGETAEFIAMAARLMLLKSRALLPRPVTTPLVPEDDPAELAAVLEEYRRFKEAASLLRGREEAGLRSFARLAPPPMVPAGTGLSNVTLLRLAEIVQAVLASHVPEPPDVVIAETVTIRQKLEQLEATLEARGVVSFTEFIGASRSRIEVVVGFMAVLELIRRGRAVAEQPSAFGDILIRVTAALPTREADEEAVRA